MKRPKVAALALTAVIALTSLAACSAETGDEGGGEAKPTITLRASNSVGPDTSFGRSYDAFAECLAERSDGSLNLQVFHSAQLGSDAETLELIQSGALDFTRSSLIANIVPNMGVMDLPYLFDDYEHWVRSVDGEPGEVIREEALGHDVRILSYDLGGWRDVYGNREIDSIDDFKGLKIRTLQTEAYLAFFDELGAVPSPMAFTEVYLALQQGTLDAAETALTSMADAKQQEVTTQVTVTHHGLSASVWIMAEATWQKLDEEQQQVVVECDAERNEMQRTQELEAIDNVQGVLEDAGMTFTEIDLDELKEIALDRVYPRVIKDAAQQEFVDMIRDLAE